MLDFRALVFFISCIFLFGCAAPTYKPLQEPRAVVVASAPMRDQNSNAPPQRRPQTSPAYQVPPVVRTQQNPSVLADPMSPPARVGSKEQQAEELGKWRSAAARQLKLNFPMPEFLPGKYGYDPQTPSELARVGQHYARGDEFMRGSNGVTKDYTKAISEFSAGIALEKKIGPTPWHDKLHFGWSSAESLKLRSDPAVIQEEQKRRAEEYQRCKERAARNAYLGTVSSCF